MLAEIVSSIVWSSHMQSYPATQSTHAFPYAMYMIRRSRGCTALTLRRAPARRDPRRLTTLLNPLMPVPKEGIINRTKSRSPCSISSMPSQLPTTTKMSIDGCSFSGRIFAARPPRVVALRGALSCYNDYPWAG